MSSFLRLPHSELGRRRFFTLVAMAAFLAAAAIGIGASAARANQLGPRTSTETNITDSEAETILGHSLPQVRDTAAGASRVGLVVSAAGAPNVPRLVMQTYARDGARTIQLTVWRGKLGATDPGAVQSVIGGRQTYVFTHVVGDGSTDVAYRSEIDELAFILHVRLVGGVTRVDADRIAASVK